MSAVPAWKRLGLKLKGASSDGSPVSAPSQTTSSPAPPAARFGHHQQQPNLNGGGSYGTPGFNKRKQFSGSYPALDSKRPRRDDFDSTPSRKSVSFSQDTKKAAPKKPKTKKPPKQQAPKQPFDFTPVLEYLRTWHKARDSWKFNKNHQTLLIKHIYNSDAIPASDIDAFYLYIQDIKGGSRKRLVEQAEEIRKKDMEAGPKGFPDGTKSPEEKQKQYEEMLAELLKKKAEIKETGKPLNGTSKRGFDEVEFVLLTVDKEVQQRVVKRMRAETIIDELESSDSEESTAMSTSSSTNATSSRVKTPVANVDPKAANGNDGAKLKSKRRKKLRTADVDSSSDSDSSDSSDSDSDAEGSEAADGNVGSSSSSSSSSSDSEEDEEMGNDNGLEEAASSSSSSSSESGEDSESESSVTGAAVAEDDDSGSDGDSESSDSDDDDA